MMSKHLGRISLLALTASLYGLSAGFAVADTLPVSSDITLSGEQHFDNNTTATTGSANGIYNTSRTAGTLTVDSDITASGNETAGIFASVAQTILNIIGNNNKLTTKSNTTGISSSAATINITDMSVDASENTGSGISINSNASNITISSTNGSKSVVADNNGQNGIESKSNSPHSATKKINITNMNVSANGNTINGIASNNYSLITITGDGNTYMDASNNRQYGILAATGGSVLAENMNLNVSNNGSGGLFKSSLSGSSYIKIIGKTGSTNNYMTVLDNRNTGVAGSADIFLIQYMDIVAGNNQTTNTKNGLVAQELGTLRLVGKDDVRTTAQSNNNTENGIAAIYSTTYPKRLPTVDISSYDVITDNNKYGIHANGQQTTINITGSSQIRNYIQSNNNSSHGLYNQSGTINITNMNIETSNNGGSGISNDGTAGVINISGDGSQSVVADNNGTNGIEGIGTATANKKINITGMNISASNNAGHGIFNHSYTNITITGNGNNYMNVSNNNAYGLYTTGGAKTFITNMDITVNNNTLGGLFENTDPSKIDITGKDGAISNTLTALDNGNMALNFQSAPGSTIKYMDVIIGNDITQNTVNGIYSVNDGVANFIGKNDYNNTIQSNKNTNYGINAARIVSSGTVNITNYDVITNQNTNGINANNGTINIKTDENSTQPHSITANENTDTGIKASNTNSQINITDMDIETNKNRIGIQTTLSGTINVSSTGGTHTLIANDNTAMGLYAYGANSQINITDMNIEASNNGQYGLFAQNNGRINIQSTDGTHTLIANQNPITAISAQQNGNITIKDMNISLDKNNYGFTTNSGGYINITNTGTSAKTLSISNGTDHGIYNGGGGNIDITNMDLDIFGNKAGIDSGGASMLNITGSTDFTNTMNVYENRYYGLFTQTLGTLNITNMNVNLYKNLQHGLYTNSGTINITGSATADNILRINDNTQSGIFASGSDAAVNITNMDIDASGNGGTGIYAERSAQITINGKTSGTSNTLISNNNKTHGIFAYYNDGGPRAKITINNMNIIANNNANNGIRAYFASMDIKGIASKNNYIQTNSNKTSGIESLASTMNITDMDIETTKNSVYGLVAYATGKMNISSSNGNKVIYANENNYYGISSMFQSSLMNITNMNIQANKNRKAGIYATDANINIIGKTTGIKNYVIANENIGHGIAAINDTRTDTVVNITNMDIDASDNGQYGIYAAENTAINISGNGRQYLNVGNNLSGIGIFADTAGSINIDRMSIFGEGNDIIVADNGSYLKIDNSSLTADSVDRKALVLKNSSTADLTNTWVITGNDTAVELNDSVLNLTDSRLENTAGYIAAATGSSASVINATGSYLHGGIKQEAGSSLDLNLANYSTWAIADSQNISGISLNASTVDLRSNTAGSYNTLTVNNFASNNGNLAFNTFLNGDTGSYGDKLILDNSGNISGSTMITVFNQGGNGDNTKGNGIMLIEAQNGTTTNANSFYLMGGIVDTGAYEYALYKGSKDRSDTNSWYLRSNGRTTGTARLIANEPAILMGMAKTGMNNLQKRMGDLRDNSPEHSHGLWVRTYAKNMTVDEQIASHMNFFGIEGGIDTQIYSTCQDKVYVGIMTGQMYLNDLKTDFDARSRASSGHGKFSSVGIYGTWLNKDGWFADATFRSFKEDIDMLSYSSSIGLIKYSPDRRINLASFEFGRKMEFAQNEENKSKWTIEPKLEALYGFSNSKHLLTSNGNTISYGDTETRTARAAVDIGYHKEFDNNVIVKPFVHFGIVNENEGKTKITYADHRYSSDISGTSFEIGAGLDVQLDEELSFYSDITYEKGTIIESTSTNLGLRYTF